MKTLSAILAHAGIGAIQAVVAANAVPQDQAWSPFANIGVQIGSQAALTALHGILARKNSNTDPNGNRLLKLDENKFVSVPKEPKE